MPIAVDSSVLVDVLVNDPQHAERSGVALQEAARQSGLIVCEVVVAEILPVIGEATLEEFFSDLQITFVPSSVESATLAGQMFRRYLERGGKRGRVVPDFLIGAHAQVHAQGLLARDRGYYRDYFRDLRLLDPSRPK